jgi:hypothetical protein
MSAEPAVSPVDRFEDDPIEGGTITDLADELPFHEAQHRAHTARRLAYWLVVVLGATMLVHYASVMFLEIEGKHEAVESLSSIFHAFLPVISGLVGGATTFYFTQKK